MHDIIRCEFQMERLTDFRMDDIGTPTTVLCHLRMDERRASPEDQRRANRKDDSYNDEKA
jgi:hypothetical protein